MRKMIFRVFLISFAFLSYAAQAQEKDSLLIVIDGVVSTQAKLEEVSSSIERINYLSARDAAHIYGTAGGAILVKTRENNKREPVVLMDGEPVLADSLNNISFRKIDVITGHQALSLFGPSGKEGVWLVQSADAPELKNVRLEVKDKSRKPLRGIRIKDSTGELLGVTNRCGVVYLENYSSGNSVYLSGKKFAPKKIEINSSQTTIELERK